jgi:hypothetical protein
MTQRCGPAASREGGGDRGKAERFRVTLIVQSNKAHYEQNFSSKEGYRMTMTIFHFESRHFVRRMFARGQ